jgi:arginine decarboxylase
LYIGFFNTGAYQEALSGYGGIKHCLTPSPKTLVVSKAHGEKLEIQVFSDPQSADSMLSVLGY